MWKKTLLVLLAVAALSAAGGLIWFWIDPVPFYLWRLERGPSDWAVEKLGELGDSRAVEPLAAVVKDKSADRWTRCRAVEALGKIGGERAVPQLLAELRDLDSPVGLNGVSAWALEQLDAVPQSGTEDFITYVIWQDIDRIQFVGEPAVEPLVAVADGLFKRRRSQPLTSLQYEHVLEMLGKLKDPRGVRPLADILREEDPDYTDEAAFALGQIGGPEAGAALAEALTSDDEGIQLDALWGLMVCADPRGVEELIELLASPLVSIRKKAVDTLGRIGDERAVEALLAALDNPVRRVVHRLVRRDGKLILEEAECPGDKRYKEQLRRDNEDLRGDIVEALGRIGSDRVVETLSEILHGDDAKLRTRAITALAHTGNAKAVVALVAATKDPVPMVDPDSICRKFLVEPDGRQRILPIPQAELAEESRRRVVHAIGDIGDDGAVAALVEMLRGSDARVRAPAAATLAYTGRADAVEPVMESLQDRDPRVRESTAWALSQFDKEKADPAFLKAFAEDNEEVQALIAAASGEIKTPNRIIAELEDGRMPLPLAPTPEAARAHSEDLREKHWREWNGIQECRRYARRLGACGNPRAVPVLLKVLENQKVYVPLRSEVALALGKFSDARAITALTATLQDEGESTALRAAAAKALIESGDAEATAAGVEIWHDPEESRKLRAAIAEALAESDKFKPLIAVLEDEDDLDWVRGEAAKQLGKTRGETVVAALEAATNDERPLVRYAAARALKQLGKERNKGLLPSPREDWVRRLGVRFATEWNESHARRCEFGTIVDRESLRKPAGEMLILALNDVHAINREWAAWTLSDWRDTPLKEHLAGALKRTPWEIEPAVPPLIKTLGDSDPNVRSAAAWVLGEIGDTRAVEPLVGVLKKQSEPVRVRRSAAWALGDIGDLKAVEALEAVKDADAPLQRTIERALEKLKKDE